MTELVDSCPVTCSSPQRPAQSRSTCPIDYSILPGQRRYSHITAPSGDSLMTGLLGVVTFRIEDSVLRAFEDANDHAITTWIDQ